MDSAILSKMLFRKAVSLYSPQDTFSWGLTVSLLQDAAEMLVWHLAKKTNAQIKSKDGFVALVENLDKNHGGIFLKAEIFELNSARVNFKHYGNIPANSEIPKFIEFCEHFLIRNSEKHGIDFDALTYAETVNISVIKEPLIKSEQLIEKSEFEEALIYSSIAFQNLEDTALSKFNVHKFDLDNLRESYEAWPIDNQESARDFTYKLTNILEKIIDNSSRALMGFDLSHFNRIKSMCLIVNISMTGNILGATNMGNAKADPESIRYINNFIIEASRKLS